MSSFDKGAEDVKTLVGAINKTPKFARLCIYTLNCFGNLSQNRDNLDRIASEGGFESTLTAMRNHRNNSRLIIEGTRPLINACRVPEHARRIGENGGIEFCLEQLSTSKDPASNAEVAMLLKALCDGDPSNVQRLKDLGGEEVLRKELREANARGDEKLAASLLSVLESLTADKAFCDKIAPETIEAVAESLHRFPGDPAVVLPAINIINNLAYGANVEKLRSLNCVKLISNAMNANASNKMIKDAGEKALLKLSDKSDFEHAVVEMSRKSLMTIEKIEIISLIGNLTKITGDIKLLKSQKILQKLAAIIKSLTKLEKNTDDDNTLLIAALQAAGKVAAKDEEGSLYFASHIFDSILKILENKNLTPQILAGVNISLENLTESPTGRAKILAHPKLLPKTIAQNEQFKGSAEVRAAAIVLYRQLGSDATGLARLSELKAVEQLAKFVSQNVKKSEMVINVYDAFLAFAKNVGVLSEAEVGEMVDSAVLGLKSDPDDVPLCRKALELLLALAGESQYARDMLSKYEYSSILSKFKSETSNIELMEMVDALKLAIMRVSKTEVKASPEDLLKKIDDESNKISENETNTDNLGEMFKASETLLMGNEAVIEKIRKAGGVEILKSALRKTQKAKATSIKDEVETNLMKLLNRLNEDGQMCEEWLKEGFYGTLAAIFVSTQNLELQTEIIKSVDQLKAIREAQMIILSEIDYKDVGRMMEQLKYCTFLTEKLLALPVEMRGDLPSVQRDIDIVVKIVQECRDDNVVLAALSFLDLLTQSKTMHRSYFADTYIESMCHIVKNNADNDIYSSSILSLLAQYEQDPNAVVQITDLKQWYLNQTLETDLEELKFFLLDSIYNVLNDKSRETELQTLLQRLANCYDPNNVLVDLTAKATTADIEVVKLIPFLLDDLKSNEVKSKATALVAKMVKNKDIERLFYDAGVLKKLIYGMQTASSREERLIYMTILSSFMTSENPQIQKLVQDAINEMLMMALNMDELSRDQLLDDLILTMETDGQNFSIRSESLESLLKLLEHQKTAEGRARVLTIITRMLHSSEEVARQMADGRGLALTMRVLGENKDEPVYVGSMSAMTVALAEHRAAVPRMFEEAVDERMKDVMFQYTSQKDIFHNAQRTIDLMNLGSMDLSDEDILRMKERSRIKQLMTELCRALGIKISSVLTRGEREISTGDTAQDISSECRRILNEFGQSFDDSIENDSPTKLLTSLGEAWLLRAYLMTYTFLVEKDVSARSVINAPTKIEETLVYKCKFTAMWDFENKDFKISNRAVRGGIAHQSVNVMLDSSVEPLPCQEVDIATKAPVGDEYTLEDLITWVKLDVEEKDTLRCFNLVLSWVMNNWNLVTITTSIMVRPNRKGEINPNNLETDGHYLSLRCGLNWEWGRSINPETFYIVHAQLRGKYLAVEKIVKKTSGAGLHIKVNISGDELRKKRREIQHQLDFSHSNVLTVEEKDFLEFFIDMSGKGTVCRKYSKALLKTKEETTSIKFNQEEDGDLYFTWGDNEKSFEERLNFNMKEVEGVFDGKTTKTFKKVKSANEDNCFALLATNDRDINLQLENKTDRDMWVRGLRLVLCTIANCKLTDMAW